MRNCRLAFVAAGLGIGAAITVAAPSAWADTADADSGVTRSRAISHRPEGRGPLRAALTTVTGLTVTRSGQSPLTLSSGATGAAELSGVSYGGEAGGTGYYAVGDDGAGSIWNLYASFDTRDGRLRSALVTGGISAPELGADSEGIAVGPDRDRAWVADEATSTITEFSLSDGERIGAVAVPAIYRPANVQDNLGLESLSYGDGTLWTANEEALRPDGSVSTTSAGSWVRIQSFQAPDLAPARQYAYLTDPISAMSPLVSVERSGLVDLVALPGGQLLALERELGGFLPLFRSRVYQVGLDGASDVAALPSLTAGGFTPVTKTLLWQGYFAFINLEGMTLGPRLTGGGRSLLLVSDDGGGALGQRQVATSLVLRGPAV